MHVLPHIAPPTLVLSGSSPLFSVEISFSSPCTSQYYGGIACRTVFGKSVAGGTYLLGLLYFDVSGIFAATSKRSRARCMLNWPMSLNTPRSERLLVDCCMFVAWKTKQSNAELG